MDYTKKQAFAEGLVKLAKEHGFTIMIGDGKKLVETTKGLEGQYMFFTKGEKVLALRGSGETVYDSSITLKLHKNRYGKE